MTVLFLLPFIWLAYLFHLFVLTHPPGSLGPVGVGVHLSLCVLELALMALFIRHVLRTPALAVDKTAWVLGLVFAAPITEALLLRRLYRHP